MNQRGFSLVELIVTIAIITIISAPLVSIFIFSSQINSKSGHVLDASYIAQRTMEELYDISIKKDFEEARDALKTGGYTEEVLSLNGDYTYKALSGGRFVQVYIFNSFYENNMAKVIVDVFEDPAYTNRLARLENILAWKDS